MDKLYTYLFSVVFVFLLVTVAVAAPSVKKQNPKPGSDTSVDNNDAKKTDDAKKAQPNKISPPPSSTPSTSVNKTKCVGNNGTDCVTTSSKSRSFGDMFNQNKGMLLRTMYVLIGITAVVILCFAVKTIRLRRRRSKTKKYGVISTPGHDNMEMTPLDQDDDDEDMTVFELNNGHMRK
ncbi:uncharacterized protein LOC141905472 [Tubulanus polymorphus]|uniref:uncharacterized protein LOC141905472 n=1 Tax=Tubulanus polymorphus TaxID=672921 RepID=UPI003DA4186E